jgi:hypothetical protein
VRSTEIAERSYGLSRRQYILGAVGAVLTVVTGYAGVAAAKNYWPFESEDPGGGKSIAELARDLSNSGSSGERVAVLHAIGGKAVIGHPERAASVDVLTEFLRTQKGIPQDRRERSTEPEGKAPPEISLAFSILGKSGTKYDEADLRGANLSGIDVSGLDFAGGVTMFGARMAGAMFADCNFGTANWGEITMSGSWFAECFLSGLNLIDSNVGGSLFPGSRLLGCQFAGADVTSSDFSSSKLEECDFAGERLNSNGHRNAHWSAGRAPKWPDGYSPNIR